MEGAQFLFADRLLEWKSKLISEGWGLWGLGALSSIVWSSVVSLELKFLQCDPPHESFWRLGWGQKGKSYLTTSLNVLTPTNPVESASGCIIPQACKYRASSPPTFHLPPTHFFPCDVKGEQAGFTSDPGKVGKTCTLAYLPSGRRKTCP